MVPRACSSLASRLSAKPQIMHERLTAVLAQIELPRRSLLDQMSLELIERERRCYLKLKAAFDVDQGIQA